jgi:putative component of membrane protein insertase Oxa1/YidC/SpoIIIJ protein YidD
VKITYVMRQLLISAVRRYRRWEGRPLCRKRFDPEHSCSERMLWALQYAALTQIMWLFPQILFCCGQSHRGQPSTARPRPSPHGGTRTTQPGRRNPKAN